MATTKITGQTLIDLGYEPAKWFGPALRFLEENPLSDQELLDYIESIIPEEIEKIDMLDEPVKYHINLEANTEYEKSNYHAVIKTMNEVMRIPTVVDGAVMPDACPSGPVGTIPVGGVVVTEHTIHPGMHSADICCSLFATEIDYDDLEEVLNVAMEVTQFGPGKRKGHGGWTTLLDDNSTLTNDILGNYFTRDYIEKARLHLGTQGDGNHFLFVGRSRVTGKAYIITHHGSRGFGASVFKKGFHEAEKYTNTVANNIPKQNAWLDYRDDLGKEYWRALQIVRDWTKFNHQKIHDRILHRLKISYTDRFWNEHNFVFKGENDRFYHAKGSTPMKDIFLYDGDVDGRRIIPLNMSEPILIVKSKSIIGEMSESSLGFAPHGAGRNMSRSEFVKKNSKYTKEELVKRETKGIDVRFYSGEPDISELPSAYKNAEDVRKQIVKFGLGFTHDEIIPYGTIMAGMYNKPWLKKK